MNITSKIPMNNTGITIIVLFYMLWSCIPYVFRHTHISFGVVLIGVALLLSTLNMQYFNVKRELPVFLLLGMITFYLLIDYIMYGYNATHFFVYIKLVLFFIPAILFYFHGIKNKLHSKVIILSFLFIVILNNLTNVKLLLTDSSVSKLYTANVERIVSQYSNTNAGDLSYIVCTLLIFPVLICLSHVDINSRIIKVLAIISIALSFIVIILGSSMTSTLIFLFTCLLLIMYSAKSSAWFNLMRFLLLTILIILLFHNVIAEGVFYIAEKTDNSFYSRRLLSIGYFLAGETNMIADASGSMAFRLELIGRDLVTLFNHPITGVGFIYSHNLELVGMHSQFFDDLARYGLFGIIIFSLFYYTYVKTIKRVIRTRRVYKFFIVTLVAFALNYVFNPSYTPSYGFIMFYLTPYVFLHVDSFLVDHINGMNR